ncbi:MAG TPA: hypothetical protein VNW06_11025 [Cytophagaceae bacterium]|nr:hypothetical protein [Cytophagaceae bacterium]
MNQSEIIARLILSTKRKKRELSIVEIATDIAVLRDMLGGLKEVSKVIGISTEMLNQFLSVFKLPTEIQSLVKERKIDKVAVVFLLSRFSERDSMQLIKGICDRTISSQELKILLPYRKQHLNENILDLIQTLRASENIKVSVIRIPKNITRHTDKEIADIIKDIVGIDDFIEVAQNHEFYDIKIGVNGVKKLRGLAKERKMTLSTLIATLIK